MSDKMSREQLQNLHDFLEQCWLWVGKEIRETHEVTKLMDEMLVDKDAPEIEPAVYLQGQDTAVNEQVLLTRLGDYLWKQMEKISAELEGGGDSQVTI